MDQANKVTPEINFADRFFEIAGWLFLFVIWVLTIRHFPGLPDKIPVHFNASGIVDDYGPKYTLFYLPGIVTILYVGLTVLNRYPQIFNFPVKVTEHNRQALYTISTRMIRFLKLALVVIFLLIEWGMLKTAAGVSEGLGAWFMPVTLSLVFVPLIYFMVAMVRAR